MAQQSGSVEKIGSNAAHLLEFSAGFTATASAASIAFLWSNWDVLYRIFGGVFQAERVTEIAWRGSGFGGSGEWCLLNSLIGVDEGRFEFYSTIRFLGVPTRGTSVFEYRRVDPARISYFGRSWGALPWQLKPCRWLVEILGTKATARVNFIGTQAAEMITRDPKLVEKHAGAARYNIFLEMIDEEEALLRSQKRELRFFHYNPRSEGKSPWGSLGGLRRDLDLLDKKIAANGRNIGLQEYTKCFDLLPVDQPSAVANMGKILEPIVLRIYEAEFMEAVGQVSTFDQISRIYRERNRKVPRDITSFMQTVNGLRNLAVHLPSLINESHFKVALPALLGVAEWFFQSNYAKDSNDVRGGV